MADLPQNWQSDFITKICKIYQPKTIATSQLISGGEYPVFGANGQIGFYDTTILVSKLSVKIKAVSIFLLQYSL